MQMNQKRNIVLDAPAKINLRLKVLGRQPNGYHLLDMIMVPLTLADEITLEEKEGPSSLSASHEAIPTDGSNTLMKVLAKVKQLRPNFSQNFHIHLNKKTPTAAGLGGGSSDAATLLMALNDHYDLKLSETELATTALSVGADVPFFLKKKAQRAEGVGEILSNVEGLPSFHLILVNPNFPVSTPQVYGWYDELSEPNKISITNPLKPLTQNSTDASHAALSRSLELWFEKFPLENDLEKVVLPRNPVLSEIKETLYQCGALGAMMSGSGPTVFGFFISQTSRDRGFELLKQKAPRSDQNWWMCPTDTVGC